jgi:8-oxo-dGTP pyrophosphatase MutT (NUDIX family)
MALPVSIKGVLFVNGGAVLVKSPVRGWELPGGHLEHGESPEQTLIREVAEELGIRVSVEHPLHSYVLEIVPGRPIFYVAYRCKVVGLFAPSLSDEHTEYRICSIEQLSAISLRREFRESIERGANAV